ncbi:hypothetical protein L6164_002852 [Bauhinia variegata]|uniref:Uncharacterized protein n=1 Tax=Bauhinia variegata TaxID=167791 RepID=A0ACB9PZC7_BAUVA|nr:hypothetical protein L6164_002852 [Bauhinia variegata]
MAEQIQTEAPGASLNEQVQQMQQYVSGISGSSTTAATAQTTTGSNPKAKSIVWDHFIKLPLEQSNGEEKAKCHHCKRDFLCNSTRHGTNGMLKHLKSQHKWIFADKNQSLIGVIKGEDGLGGRKTVVSITYNVEEIRKAFAVFVIEDEMPFSVVEGRGFHYFVNRLEPKFPVPSRRTITRDCYQLFLDEKDNASSNDVAISYLKKKLKNWNGLVCEGAFMHMRCAAHILNLIVNDGLKDLSPSIVAIRNAIWYVRSSPQRLQKFKQAAHAEKISSGASLCFDVPTRWNSTYIMLEHAIPFQKAFDRLEDEDEGYVVWFKEDRRPSIFDGDNARAFVQFLKLFYEVTLALSGSLHVTSNCVFDEIQMINELLIKWSENEADSIVGTMACNMRNKLEKYWGKVENINPLIYIGIVLDPRYKLEIQEVFDEFQSNDDVINEISGAISSVSNQAIQEGNRMRESVAYLMGVPPWNTIRNMKSLTLLELRNDNISGPIPSYIGEFSSLTGLDLSYNNLSGSFLLWSMNKKTAARVDGKIERDTEVRERNNQWRGRRRRDSRVHTRICSRRHLHCNRRPFLSLPNVSFIMEENFSRRRTGSRSMKPFRKSKKSNPFNGLSDIYDLGNGFVKFDFFGFHISAANGVAKCHNQNLRPTGCDGTFAALRRLAEARVEQAEEVSTAHNCARKNKVPLLSVEALHHLHILIFVLAIVHLTFCVLTIAFGRAKIRQWKHWEDEIAKKNYESTDSALLGWLHSFFKQFYGSVTKLDYQTLRLGFTMFNFHKYMICALEDDFKQVVGIIWYLWVFMVVFLLLNINDWHTYFWIVFIPFVIHHACM